MKWLFSVSAAVALLVAPAGAASLFNYDFTAGEGFADGGLSTQNGIDAQAQWQVANSGTNGEVIASAPAFQRFSFQGSQFDWNALNVGDMVVLNANGLSTTSNNGNTHQLSVLGLTTLTTSNAENPGGNGNSQLGGQLTTNGTNYVIDEGTFGVSGGAVDTGIALGNAIDYQVKITKQSATTADVLQTVTDGTISAMKLDLGVADATNGAANLGAGGTINLDDAVAVIFQTQNGNVGPISIDSMSAEIVPDIPEPASLACLSLLAFMGLGVRRRS